MSQGANSSGVPAETGASSYGCVDDDDVESWSDDERAELRSRLVSTFLEAGVYPPTLLVKRWLRDQEAAE